MGYPTLFDEVSIIKPAKNIHEMDRYSLQSSKQ